MECRRFAGSRRNSPACRRHPFSTRRRSDGCRGNDRRSSRVSTEMRTFADGSDLAHDVETRHVRERAWADAVQTPGEELPVDGVDRRKRHSYLHLARARGGDLDIRELEVGDGVRGVTLRAIRGGLPGFHGGYDFRSARGRGGGVMTRRGSPARQACQELRQSLRYFGLIRVRRVFTD